MAEQGGGLRAEIKQAKPFASMKQELYLNLCRTAAVLQHEAEGRLRPFGLSPTQYNVLRILRGAGGEGLCQYEIRERLVAQVPDVPRILERMERSGLVARVRGERDRRVVMATATGKGLGLLEELEGPMAEWSEGMFTALGEGEMREMNGLLERARVARGE